MFVNDENGEKKRNCIITTFSIRPFETRNRSLLRVVPGPHVNVVGTRSVIDCPSESGVLPFHHDT